MDCFRCGRHVDYDRVAVNRRSGDVEGSLCMDCEAAWMNGHGENGHGENGHVSMATCFECGSESDFLFPKWDSIVERDDSDTVETEYRIQLVTPASCGQCVEQ